MKYLLLLLLAMAGSGTALSAVFVEENGGQLAIGNADQRVAWRKNTDGNFLATVEARKGEGWHPVFDGEAPPVQGIHFNLHPVFARVVEESPQRVVAEVGGKHPDAGYNWTARWEANAGSSWLHCRISCQLAEPLILAGLEPQVAFWSRATSGTAAVTVDQGPGNIYSGSAEVEWGNSFPAAYCWQDGMESAIFFDAGSMDWMSPRNLFRFRDCRVQSWAENGRTGFGLRVVKRNFHELPAGEVAWSFWLHTKVREDQPTRLQALDRLVRLAGPLHPVDAAPMDDLVAMEKANWTTIARQVNLNLLQKGVVWDDFPIPEDAPWRDLPAFPEHTVSSVRISTDYAVDSACDPAAARKAVADGWDFSTCNNYLGGWLVHDRFHPDAARREFLAGKLQSLPLFFDPETLLFRHGTRYPRGLGPKEMSWQNFAFAIEVDKIRRVLPPRKQDPALAGKFLQGAGTLAEFARKVDYLFPQWFDPILKKPLVQGDLPELGVIQEPWQAGSYAWIQCSAYEISDDRKYLDEAKIAMDRLFGGMKFKVLNERYQIEYDDPVDFPVTEIFGNAWGVAAGAKLYALTNDKRYQQASDDFLNSLLRLTYWYESRVRGDARDQAVRSAGLFRNHGGAWTGSPWENGEAYLALSVRLRADLLRGEIPREPLLRMFHLFRHNSATFFPPVFPETAQPCSRVMDHVSDYLPIEDTYTLEHGGKNGGMGRAAYMSGIAFWNELLFESLADCSDPEITVVNLDAVEGIAASADGIQRNFVIFNAGDSGKTAALRLKQLSPGSYTSHLQTPSGSIVDNHTVTAGSLTLDINLAPGQHLLLTIKAADADQRLTLLQSDEETARHLARQYQAIQTAAVAAGGKSGESPAKDEAAQKASYLQQRDNFLKGPP